MDNTFRTISMPGELFQMMASKAVLPVEVMLLALVETMVTPQQGCWASNATLGERLGLTGHRARQIIAKLEGLGLLKRTTGPHPCGEGESRFLLTAWSRLTLFDGKGGASVLAGGCQPISTKRLSTTYLSSTRVRKAKVQDVTTKEDTSMLFPEVSPNTPTTPSPEDVANATMLIDTLRHHHRITGPRSNKRHAESFRLLRTTDKVEAGRIATVLKWYVANATGQYTPHVYNGDMFRKKFLQIEAAMVRERLGMVWVAPNATSVTEITPLTNLILSRLTVRWRNPRDAEDCPAFVELCSQTYIDWVRRAREYIRKNKPEIEQRTRLGITLDHLSRVIETTEHFVAQWVADIHVIACEWKEYKPGALRTTWVINPRKDKFRNIVRKWITAYNPDTVIANKILEAIDAG